MTRLAHRTDGTGHWLMVRDGKVVGCHCGFVADMEADSGYGDSVLDHFEDVVRGEEAADRDRAVEAARRDALTGAMEGNALARAVGWDDGYLQGRRDALTEAIARYDAEHEGPPGRARAILTDLRSAP